MFHFLVPKSMIFNTSNRSGVAGAVPLLLLSTPAVILSLISSHLLPHLHHVVPTVSSPSWRHHEEAGEENNKSGGCEGQVYENLFHILTVNSEKTFQSTKTSQGPSLKLKRISERVKLYFFLMLKQ